MPKNVMCKKCNNLINGWCEKKIDSPDPNMVRDCQYFWEKTNADRIRSMSDEELSELLEEMTYDRMEHRANYWLKWLKQAAE